MICIVYKILCVLKHKSSPCNVRLTYVISREIWGSRPLYHFCQSKQARLADRWARIYFGMSLIYIEICISIARWYGPLFRVLRLRLPRDLHRLYLHIGIRGLRLRVLKCRLCNKSPLGNITLTIWVLHLNL